jgi:hypothetical protein
MLIFSPDVRPTLAAATTPTERRTAPSLTALRLGPRGRGNGTRGVLPHALSRGLKPEIRSRRPTLCGVKIPGASPGAFDRTTSMPIPLHSLHLRSSRERERVATAQPSRSKPWSPLAPPQAGKLRGIGPLANEVHT